jgi:hypothetical protein
MSTPCSPLYSVLTPVLIPPMIAASKVRNRMQHSQLCVIGALTLTGTVGWTQCSVDVVAPVPVGKMTHGFDRGLICCKHSVANSP